MKLPAMRPFCSSPQDQRGMSALVVTLILLVAITLPAVAIMRATLVSEQGASSEVDRQRAFQAAEAALVEGEIFSSTTPTVPASGCSGGICSLPVGDSWYKAAGFWDGAGPRNATAEFDGVKGQYVVEFLNKGTNNSSDCSTSGDISPDAACSGVSCKYRVIARGISPTGAEVLLQSNFMVPDCDVPAP